MSKVTKIVVSLRSVFFYCHVTNEYFRLKIDGIVKSRFKDWIPAFAGMTPVVSI
jgi:hypothetical protein